MHNMVFKVSQSVQRKNLESLSPVLKTFEIEVSLAPAIWASWYFSNSRGSFNQYEREWSLEYKRVNQCEPEGDQHIRE